MRKIAFTENLADPFTKALPFKVFEEHLEAIALKHMSHLL